MNIMEIIFQIILLAIIAYVCYIITNWIYESPLEKFSKALEYRENMRRSVEAKIREELYGSIKVKIREEQKEDLSF